MEELIVKERKFREHLADLVNNSNLPAIIIKPIIKELFEQLNTLEQKQYEEAIKMIAEKKDGKEYENE